MGKLASSCPKVPAEKGCQDALGYLNNLSIAGLKGARIRTLREHCMPWKEHCVQSLRRGGQETLDSLLELAVKDSEIF